MEISMMGNDLYNVILFAGSLLGIAGFAFEAYTGGH